MNKGLGDPTPTKNQASVRSLDCLVAMKCQHALAKKKLIFLKTPDFHFPNCTMSVIIIVGHGVKLPFEFLSEFPIERTKG